MDTNNSRNKTENQIQCLLVSRLIAEQTFVPNKIDQEAYLNVVRMAITVNSICNDYLNKKDEDRFEVK